MCVLLFPACRKEAMEQKISPAFTQPFKTDHSKAMAIQAIIDEFASKGIPGIVVAVHDKEGTWEGTSGFAKIETGEKLKPGFVHAAGSITKTYVAAAFLRLKELQQVNFDVPITTYIPNPVKASLGNGNAITVRMLLNHSSGIPDYIEDPTFGLHWLNDLSQQWTTNDVLKFIYNHNLLFAPGADYEYSNSNYILLSIILEKITGKQEGAWLKENIFDKAGLTHTYYRTGPEFLEHLPLPNYYLDRYGDGRLQNVSLAARTEIYSERGDGGLVATALDLAAFMNALVKGNILTAASLNEMKTWFKQSEYGLGLETGFNYNKQVQYGHLGAVFGGASLLLYFEKQETSLFIGVTTDASLISGKTLSLCHEMKNKIAEYIAAQ
jgi:D-alanyl-D-alanine carboxypeptidase